MLLVGSLSLVHLGVQFARYAPPAFAQVTGVQSADEPDTSTERLDAEGPAEQSEAAETLQGPSGTPAQVQENVQAAAQAEAQAQAGAQEEAQAQGAEQAEAQAEAAMPAAEAPPIATEQPVEGETAQAPAQQAETPAQRIARLEAEQAAYLERIDELTQAVNQLNENQQLLDERTAAIQDEATAVEERGAGLEAARVDRVDAYGVATERTGDVETYLAAGDTSGADAAMMQLADDLGTLADNAFDTSGELEADQAGAAQDAVQAARDFLAQGDLYNARISLGVARMQLSTALRAAQGSAQPLFRGAAE